MKVFQRQEYPILETVQNVIQAIPFDSSSPSYPVMFRTDPVIYRTVPVLFGTTQVVYMTNSGVFMTNSGVFRIYLMVTATQAQHYLILTLLRFNTFCVSCSTLLIFNNLLFIPN